MVAFLSMSVYGSSFFLKEKKEEVTNCIVFVKSLFPSSLQTVILMRDAPSPLYSSQGPTHKFVRSAPSLSWDMESMDLPKLMDTLFSIKWATPSRARCWTSPEFPLTSILIHMCSEGGDHTWWFSTLSQNRHLKIYRHPIRFPVAIGASFCARIYIYIYIGYTWHYVRILSISFLNKNICMI